MAIDNRLCTASILSVLSILVAGPIGCETSQKRGGQNIDRNVKPDALISIYGVS